MVIFINIFLYWRTIFYGLVIDDIEWYTRIKNGFFNNRSLIESIRLRLYGGGTFTTNLKLDHAFTLFLHTLTCILINLKFGLLCACLYSIHPLTHQTSVWLTGRRYSILNILFLLFLLTPMPYRLLFLIPVFIYLPNTYRNYTMRLCLKTNRSFNPVITIKLFGASFLKLFGLYRPMFFYPNLEKWGRDSREPFLINREFFMGLSSIVLCLSLPYPYNLFIFITLLASSGLIGVHQINADRYITLPLILILSLITKYIPQASVFLFPMYTHLTYNALPMYRDIQSFYDYHKERYPRLLKLQLLKQLYPTLRQ